MSLLDLFLIALGLSMDAFAVSICKGLSVRKLEARHAALCGVWFGVFQAGMPLLGFLLGSTFAGVISRFSHWVAFILLAAIGANMVRESFGAEEEDLAPDFSPRRCCRLRWPLRSTRWPSGSALRPCRFPSGRPLR